MTSFRKSKRRWNCNFKIYTKEAEIRDVVGFF